MLRDKFIRFAEKHEEYDGIILSCNDGTSMRYCHTLGSIGMRLPDGRISRVGSGYGHISPDAKYVESNKSFKILRIIETALDNKRVRLLETLLESK